MIISVFYRYDTEEQYAAWAEQVKIEEWSPVNYVPSAHAGHTLGQRSVDVMYDGSEDGNIFGLVGRFGDSTLCYRRGP